MARPQSKERLGTALLLVATWALILATVFITRCGGNGSTPPDNDAAPADTIVRPLQDNEPPLPAPEKPRKKKKQGAKTERKPSSPPPVRDMLGDTVSQTRG